MNRRTFIRVIGGGVIFSATAGLISCRREMPPEAIAAWQGPKPEADLRKWILSYGPQIEPAPRRGLEAHIAKS